MKKSAKIGIVAAACISLLIFIGPCLFVEGMYALDAVQERLSRKPFDPETWKKKEVRGVRLRMVDNLMKSHKLEGKSRDDVVALLGQPEGDISLKKRFPDWRMHYYLGPSRQTVLFRALDSDYFVVRLDAEGRVIAVAIVVLKT